MRTVRTTLSFTGKVIAIESVAVVSQSDGSRGQSVDIKLRVTEAIPWYSRRSVRNPWSVTLLWGEQ